MTNFVTLKTGHINADTVGEAFAAGLGQEAKHVKEFEWTNKEDVPAFFGILRGTGDLAKKALRNHTEEQCVYIDHGYINPGHFDGHYRVVWNGLHSRPYWLPNYNRLNAVRRSLQAVIEEAQESSWDKEDHIIIAPPSQHVTDFWGFDGGWWLKFVLDRLKGLTDREVYLTQKGDDTSGQHMLKGAHALITVQSNLAIQALAMGVRVFIVPPVVKRTWTDWWHPAETLCYYGLKDIEEVMKPSEDEVEGLLAQLAASQFTLDEMRRGLAQDWLLSHQPLKVEEDDYNVD